ncbi:MAG: hypothetical protein QOJ39_2 [Candidatus Eremiobacteraeota bacterium]|jgi:ornithine cyclodeaminase/alanine dehydrogenase-like protein (mu-crystallin family)|nr:hypothetical protein [Candidatus Eremiobacteraeota bacterium]
MRFLDEAEVERRLEAVDLVTVMRETLTLAATGEAGGPVRASLTTREGVWFAAMPAWSGGPRTAIVRV